jgi:hypothetical protein
MGMSDENSDYDLGVLIADDIEISTTEKNPITYIYKKDNKEVQCIYNTLVNIYAYPCDDFLVVYQYLCWAVFRLFKINHVIYLNPKYEGLLNTLVENQENISNNAFYSFVSFMRNSIQAVKVPSDIKQVSWGKMLTYLCWFADLLSGAEINYQLLIDLKRKHRTDLNNNELDHVFKCLKILDNYLQNTNRTELELELI